MTGSQQVELSETDVAKANRSLADASPPEVVRWAHERFHDSCVATVSLQNPVLAHLLTVHAPGIPLVFLDTQYHFKPTLDYRERLQEHLGRPIEVVEPGIPKDDRWRWNQTECCRLRKVEPTRALLTRRSAWVTGVRASDNVGRGMAAHLEYDARYPVVRVNPLLDMSDQDMDAYVATHGLPVHPLTEQGYKSIGCWPCTTPVRDGEDARAGRWRGSTKTECGLHYMYEQHPNL